MCFTFIYIDTHQYMIIMNDFEVSKICKALGDENRFKIISLLVDGEKCACELLEKFRITQPTLSHHMKILSDCELVQSRKDGKWTFYEINCCRFKEFKQYFESIQCWKDRLSASSRNGEDCCCCDGHKNVEN